MKKQKMDIETVACMAFESIRHQLKHEVKDELEKWYRWRLGIVIGLIIALVGGSGLGVLSLISWVKKDLYRRVEKVYDNKNISILVDKLIEDKAGDVIRMQASQRINSVIESEIKPVIEIHDLALKAQQGYKTAYAKLDSIANIEGYEYAELSRDIVSEIYGIVVNYYPRYFYDAGVVSEKGLTDRLKDEHVNVREMAVSSIGERGMYNQIPNLLAMLKTEENLYVLAATTYVLNKFLNSKMSIFESDFYNKYELLWRKKRNELIEKK